MPSISDLEKLGQSVWLDYIRRYFIVSGELADLIRGGLRGITSNPTIFESALSGSSDYDEALRRFAGEGLSAAEIFDRLTMDDIGLAADMFLPVFSSLDGADGFVSIETSPLLADDTEGTISEFRRIAAALGRPNVMIKIPATEAGIRALERLTAEGFSVNMTLIFSGGQYRAVAEAYIAGIEKLSAAGGDPKKVSSVASFFVSRVDSSIDRLLDARGEAGLQGRIAVASAKLAYADFRRYFSGPRWEALAAGGARLQRPLWASTGTKNPLYSETAYVDSLIGADTVSTMPIATLNAFRRRGTAAATVQEGVEEAGSAVGKLRDLGIDLEETARVLLREGIDLFVRSYRSALANIDRKREEVARGRKRMAERLGEHAPAVEKAVARMQNDKAAERLWNGDYTLWKNDPKEISNRLGWLHSPEKMLDHADDLKRLGDDLRAEGFSRALLLGMGGSSLAPEVFSRIFGSGKGYPSLEVLDSTDPDAVLACEKRAAAAKTVYIVSTKSGDTVETLSLFRFFFRREQERMGLEEAARRFIAITDPGSRLAEIAKKLRFRSVYLNDPEIGGRYSALSFFGLAPAAIAGIDIRKLLDSAVRMMRECESCADRRSGGNEGVRLGAIMGTMAGAGRDKLTLITPPSLSPFGDWLEQLIAESTGKEGKGILPVVHEATGPPESYGGDRLFVSLAFDAGPEALTGLEKAGHPVISLRLSDPCDIGGQIFLWEAATALACHLLGINPFDQPNVESAKSATRNIVSEYIETCAVPVPAPEIISDGISVSGWRAETPESALREFVAGAKDGDYVALQVFIEPSRELDIILADLRNRIRIFSRKAVTLGYGPRYLHSTGQLHKGDRGNGLFVQFTADDLQDASVPDDPMSDASSITFGVLKKAQALGDRKALVLARRRVIQFHFDNAEKGLRRLAEAFPAAPTRRKGK
ncbi:MAG: bifunctional transaldolase/phosoglucose isomerase [Syntrophales bacterium]|nr:bifunctional transaldolase/phosoglucose isomerase [Syntrophales bacterium]MDD5532609.1 bifunctional transaldolase/phosoglucose isomerase [Syntrophales bacterium]